MENHLFQKRNCLFVNNKKKHHCAIDVCVAKVNYGWQTDEMANA